MVDTVHDDLPINKSLWDCGDGSSRGRVLRGGALRGGGGVL